MNVLDREMVAEKKGFVWRTNGQILVPSPFYEQLDTARALLLPYFPDILLFFLFFL